ncbi:MAG: hypothetical protein Q4D41_10135 [Prevotellaceae bacterium]|nr:hypothetical protein [Prevotellaceae bacterium]
MEYGLFAKTFKWVLMSGKKDITNAYFTCVAVFFFFMNLNIITSNIPGDKVSLMISENMTKNIVFAIIYTIVGTNAMFNNMNTKEKRLMFKMLPSSDRYKFLSCFLIYTVVWVIGVVVAFVTADLLGMLLRQLWYGDYICSGTAILLDKAYWTDHIHFLSENVPTGIALLLLAAGTILLNSIYALGGTFFSKAKFLFTSLIILILFIIAITMNISIDPERLSNIVIDIHVDKTIEACIASAVCLIIAVFNYWLSYRLFKRMQVINNKWINI